MKLDLPTILKTIEELSPVDGPLRMTVQHYYDSLLKGTLLFVDPKPKVRKRCQEKIDRVADAVEKNKYASLRELAIITKTSKDTARRILLHDLKLMKRNLKWIPHTLNEAQKRMRVEISHKLLTELKKDEENDFIHIVTGDERRIYYSYPHDSMWTRGKEVEERERRRIDSKKIMLTVPWGVEATPIFTLLPPDESMNATTFSSLVIQPLKSWKKSSLPSKWGSYRDGFW
jgi:hypothetical protein